MKMKAVIEFLLGCVKESVSRHKTAIQVYQQKSTYYRPSEWKNAVASCKSSSPNGTMDHLYFCTQYNKVHKQVCWCRVSALCILPALSLKSSPQRMSVPAIMAQICRLAR